MKRIGNLFEKIYDFDNLWIAEAHACKGKKHRRNVQNFEENLVENLDKLSEELRTGTYKTSAYHTKTIYEPKERLIYILPYRDRVVQHAILNILAPIWTKIFIAQTYACIKGRGIHKGVRELKYILRRYPEETTYCLKMDIRHFYPSIDHELLKQIYRKKLKDPELLKLLDDIVDSAPGVPIGNYISQFFANLFLTYFDHYLKEDLKVRFYLRYADDMVILSSDKVVLHNILNRIQQKMKELHLILKPNYQIFPVEDRGIDFLGYIFRHKYTLLRKRMKLRAKKHPQGLVVYNGWLKYCNSKHLQLKLYETIKSPEMG